MQQLNIQIMIEIYLECKEGVERSKNNRYSRELLSQGHAAGAQLTSCRIIGGSKQRIEGPLSNWPV